MWWHEQDAQLQDEVRMLVSEGRLEFIGGAWSMNDEAATHYQSIVDHFTFGLKFLNDTFGECGRPKIGWQIDPFGHAREQASLFAQMGYDGLFFSRLDYQDKGNRRKTKTMEMVWHASPNLGNNRLSSIEFISNFFHLISGEQSDLFTGVLYNHYSAPPGFCFDYLCTDDPIIDNPDSPEYNLDVKVTITINQTLPHFNKSFLQLKQFYKFVEDMSLYYRTNNLALTMGDDFNYQSANFNYKNMDKLIK
jgi:lysosomal alpha-mannosidase